MKVNRIRVRPDNAIQLKDTGSVIVNDELYKLAMVVRRPDIRVIKFRSDIILRAAAAQGYN